MDETENSPLYTAHPKPHQSLPFHHQTRDEALIVFDSCPRVYEAIATHLDAPKKGFYGSMDNMFPSRAPSDADVELKAPIVIKLLANT